MQQAQNPEKTLGPTLSVILPTSKYLLTKCLSTSTDKNHPWTQDKEAILWEELDPPLALNPKQGPALL
jgi:hypothetical protein